MQNHEDERESRITLIVLIGLFVIAALTLWGIFGR
jgi:hypothetical protein